MTFAFTCPNCRSTSQVLEQFAGTRARCPTCGDVAWMPRMGLLAPPAPTGKPAIEPVPLPPPLPAKPPTPRPPKEARGSAALLATLLAAMFFLMCCGGGGALALVALVRDTQSRQNEVTSEAKATPRSGNDRPVRDDKKERPKQPSQEEKPKPEPPPAPAAPNDQAPDITNNSPSYWLQIVRDGDAVNAAKARERLVVMGRAAILELRKALRDPEPKMRVAAASVLAEMGESATGAISDLIKALSDTEIAVRAAAARALGQLGPIAHAALFALIQATSDPQPPARLAAEAAFPKVGPPTVDDVAKLLPLWSEKDALKRDRYLAFVVASKPDGAVAGMLIAPLLADSESKIRLRAIAAIAAAGPTAHAAAFGKLVACAAHGEAEVRQAALAALRMLGPAVAADRRDLEVALRSSAREVRLFGLAQLAELGAAAAESSADVARLLRDTDTRVRVAAAQTLGRIGKPAAIVLPDVLVAASDLDPNLRAAALTALARISREERIVAMLFEALSDRVREVREAAAKALRGLEPPLNRDNIPALRTALRSHVLESRRCAVAELARMGADAAVAAAEILAVVKDDDYEVRRYAFAALPALGERAKESLPFILETMSAILQDHGQKPGSLELFRQASVTYVKLGDPLDALAVWSKGVKTKDKGICKLVLESLSILGPAASKAAPDLCLLLGDAELGGPAGDTLLAMRGEDVVKALANVLEEGAGWAAKLKAVQLLGKMGPEAKNAYQALYKTSVRYAGKDLGKAASEALKEILRK